MNPGNSVLDHNTIIDFWFVETEPKQWFVKNQIFDDLITQRFKLSVNQALNEGLFGLADEPLPCLALILLLDQFTRQIYRDMPQAFSGDAQAVVLSHKAVSQGWLQASQNMNHRRFFLMPMMHSEDLAIQHASLPLFHTFTDENTLDFAQKHCAIIERFGRFPHRNIILGRLSTQEELNFLQQPVSSF